MVLKTVVSMSPTGRVTVPAAAREALRLTGEVQFEVEVTEREMIFRPAVVVPREDAWAYTAEHMASLRRALEQVNRGEVRSGADAPIPQDEHESQQVAG